MKGCHNPYFSRWFSAMNIQKYSINLSNKVTILILVDGFLQWYNRDFLHILDVCHNPYFSRWFSAIMSTMAVSAKS